MKSYNEKIDELIEAEADFISSSGASEIDFDDETMKEQLEDMTEVHFDEVIEAMRVLENFYNCTL